MKIEKQFPLQEVFAMTIFIFIMLDSQYILPMNNLLRWIFPVLLIAFTMLMTGRLRVCHCGWYYAILLVFGIACMYSPYTGYSWQRFISFVLVTNAYMVYYVYLQRKRKLEVVLETIGIQFLIYEVCNFIFAFVNSSGGRARGITGNPNSLGVWSNIAFVFSMYFLKKSKTLWSKRRNTFLMIISVVTAVASGSRTYTICILCNIVVAFFVFFSKRKRMTYMCVCGMLAVMFWDYIIKFLIYVPGIRRLLEEGTTRDMLWNAGVYLWKQHPIWGWGYGVSSKLNNFTILGHLVEEEYFGFAFHNSYLTVLIETGIVGLCAVCLYIIHVLKKGIFEYYKSHNQELFTVIMLIVNMLLCFWGGSAMTSVGSTEGFFFWGLLIWIDVYVKNNKVRNGDCVKRGRRRYETESTEYIN